MMSIDQSQNDFSTKSATLSGTYMWPDWFTRWVSIHPTNSWLDACFLRWNSSNSSLVSTPRNSMDSIAIPMSPTHDNVDEQLKTNKSHQHNLKDLFCSDETFDFGNCQGFITKNSKQRLGKRNFIRFHILHPQLTCLFPLSYALIK